MSTASDRAASHDGRVPRTERSWCRLAACLFILLSLACTSGDTGRERHRHGSSSPATASETPREGGILRIPVSADPKSFNPLLIGPERLPDAWRRLYPVLLAAEPRGLAPPLVRGDLARAWSWSPEQRTLTCTLRSARFWEDTLRVTVGDVVRSYEAYRGAGWLARHAANDSIPDPGLLTVTALDDSTVRLSFAPGFSFWRALPVAGWPVLPARKLVDLALPMLQANPLGREPLSAASFRVADWRRGLNLWLGPNPMALGRSKPYVERVEMDVCPGIDSRILRLRAGRADIVTSVPPYRLDALLEGDTLPRLYHDGIADVEMLVWNLRGPGRNVRLRRAVSLAIDRERITRDLLTWNKIACGGPAAGFLAPGAPIEAITEAPAEGAPAAVTGANARPGGTAGVDSLGGESGEATAIGPWGFSGAGGDNTLFASRSFAGMEEGTPGGLFRDSLPLGLLGARDSIPVGGPPVAAAPESATAGTPGPGLPGAAFEPEDPGARFDLEEANRLLDLAGWSERGPDGIRQQGGIPLRIEMLYERGNEFRERLATLLESDLARAGIELVAEPAASAVARTRGRAGLFETLLIGFQPPAVPDASALWASWGYWNTGGYGSVRVDSLCTKMQTEESPGAVERLARGIESIVRRDCPATFLVYREWTALLSPRVRDFHGSVSDPLRGLEGVWMADSTGGTGY